MITFPAYALAFLMMVFPMVIELSRVKLFLFAVVLATVGIVTLRTGRIFLHPAVALWTVLLSVLSSIFVLEGIVRGAPVAGSVRTTEVYVVWPILYTLAISGVRSKRVLYGLFWMMAVSTLCIGVFALLYLLVQTNILPWSHVWDVIFSNAEEYAFGLHQGYIGMEYPGVNSLPFLAPFSIAALVTRRPRLARGEFVGRACLCVAAFLGVGAALLSGRRALYLVALAAPFLTLLFLSLQPPDERRGNVRSLTRVAAGGGAAMIILLLVLNAAFGVSLSGLANRFAAGFNFSPTTVDTDATDRRVQFDALMQGWMEKPLFGAGHGMAAFGCIRSEVSPWNYELYYNAILYQTGLLGFGAYMAGILWIYWIGFRVIRSGGYLSALVVPCLVGLSSILIANATNPYLARYDAMWAIFFPLMVVNIWLLRDSRQRRTAKLVGAAARAS